MAARGEANGHAKLSRDDVIEVRRRYAAGEAGTALAKEYGLARAHMYRVIQGSAWREVPTERRLLDRRPSIEGDRNPSHRKLSEADVLDIRDFSAGGFTGSSLAKTYGVSLGYIYKVIHGSAWKHVKPDGHPLGS